MLSCLFYNNMAQGSAKTDKCCGSSVVEHSLGKGEVESSILSRSTIPPASFLPHRHNPIFPPPQPFLYQRNLPAHSPFHTLSKHPPPYPIITLKRHPTPIPSISPLTLKPSTSPPLLLGTLLSNHLPLPTQLNLSRSTF
uniref:Uncharacterized protein n=1 Tax=Bartonella schoenbuchensis (strain DSM 13525 / NCTC 13165 / R1) TaxID=687861 RepID=E6Z1E3_BARSR|nr:hypothetical protein BARSC_190204 [Bartonella schoenbuchensis R1]